MNDITRCYGHNCDKRDQCRRYKTIIVDPVGLFSYVSSMNNGRVECDNFIEDKQHNESNISKNN